MEINFRFLIDEKDLHQAISFLYNGTAPGAVQQIMKDYFSNNWEIDMDRIRNHDEKSFHIKGLVASLITLIGCMEDAPVELQSKIITLNS